MNPLSAAQLGNIFSHRGGCPFTLLIIFAETHPFDEIPFTYFYFCLICFWDALVIILYFGFNSTQVYTCMNCFLTDVTRTILGLPSPICCCLREPLQLLSWWSSYCPSVSLHNCKFLDFFQFQPLHIDFQLKEIETLLMITLMSVVNHITPSPPILPFPSTILQSLSYHQYCRIDDVCRHTPSADIF